MALADTPPVVTVTSIPPSSAPSGTPKQTSNDPCSFDVHVERRTTPFNSTVALSAPAELPGTLTVTQAVVPAAMGPALEMLMPP
jgi:hypothetical protein